MYKIYRFPAHINFVLRDAKTMLIIKWRKENEMIDDDLNGLIYNSSWTSEPAEAEQAAGVCILYKYSHRFGSLTPRILVSRPHLRSTMAERDGPFQQPAPFA